MCDRRSCLEPRPDRGPESTWIDGPPVVDALPAQPVGLRDGRIGLGRLDLPARRPVRAPEVEVRRGVIIDNVEDTVAVLEIAPRCRPEYWCARSNYDTGFAESGVPTGNSHRFPRGDWQQRPRLITRWVARAVGGTGGSLRIREGDGNKSAVGGRERARCVTPSERRFLSPV